MTTVAEARLHELQQAQHNTAQHIEHAVQEAVARLFPEGPLDRGVAGNTVGRDVHVLTG
ncbi:hypothetical protein ACWDR9_12350 [Streptosporangium sandarakinum]